MDRRWKGGAKKVAQVQTYTFGGTWDADDVVRIQIGQKIVDVTAGSTTTTTVVDNVVSAWNALSAEDYPEFAESTASRSSSNLVITADTAGRPLGTITITPLEANGGAADAQTIEGAGAATTGTTATASAGPNDWSTAANWSGSTAPTTGDNVYIDTNAYDILYGLDQSGVTLTLLVISGNYPKIGLPELNQQGSTSYPEHRPTYLKIGATTARVGDGPGNPSSRVKLDTSSIQTALEVNGSGFSEETGLPAVMWKGTHANNTVSIRGSASFGAAVFGGESATILTLKVDGSPDVRLGPSVTLGAATVNDGTVEINSAVGTSLTMYGGTVTINGTGAVAQLNVHDGVCVYNTSGTLGGNTVVGAGGEIDFSQDPRTKTVTNPIDAYGTSPVLDPDKVVSSLVIDYNGVAPIESLGANVRLTRGTPA